jgi:hypothetical protein
MRSKKPLTRSASIRFEMVCHAFTGVALGLGFSFALALLNSHLASLIAHSGDPKTATIIIVSFFTLAFGVGATLTGYVFTMMQER